MTLSQVSHSIYHNADAKLYKSNRPASDLIRRFHEGLPDYEPTPLIPLDEVAQQLGVKGVYLKNESCRIGLPSFKILGASWATYVAVSKRLGLTNPSMEELSREASDTGITLFAATDGNHGRAVARMARLLGIASKISVPYNVDAYTQGLIADEGAAVTAVQGDYDTAVETAAAEANKANPLGILIQDTAFAGYETIPSWIVDGYSTMLNEIDEQARDYGLQPTVLVCPVGVGSLCQAVVTHGKGKEHTMSILAVEPDRAACLHLSLKAGRIIKVNTSKTIMDGLECGSVSSIAWPILRDGVDASVAISDSESHRVVQYLGTLGIHLGPCGAAGLAGLQNVAAAVPGAIGLSEDSVVVILGTEGARPYSVAFKRG